MPKITLHGGPSIAGVAGAAMIGGAWSDTDGADPWPDLEEQKAAPEASETVAASVEWSPGSTIHVPAPEGGEPTVEVTGAVVGDAGPELVVPLSTPPAYADMTVAQLQAELERRGLPKTGNKRDLVSRLEEHDLGEASA